MWKMLLAIVVLLGSMPLYGAEIKNGEAVAFLGDSITALGAKYAPGYVRLFESACIANGIDVKIIPAGVSGNKSNNMLARLDRDVIAKRPNYMTLSCGINDVWHGEIDPKKGVSLEDYKQNITKIVEKAQNAGIKVIVLTATIYENEGKKDIRNDKLIPYNDFLRELAAQKNCQLVDLNAAMWAELTKLRAQAPHGNHLTGDGVHMSCLGNLIMAEGVIKGFGFTEEEVAKAKARWQQCWCGPFGLTIGEYQKISAMALAKHQTAKTLIDNVAGKAVKELLKQ